MTCDTNDKHRERVYVSMRVFTFCLMMPMADGRWLMAIWTMIPHNESDYWYREDYYRSYVSRTNLDGNVIIGKKTNVSSAIHPNGSSWFQGSIYEWLVVEPRCSVTWEQHDSTSGQPLPRGALIGGLLTDTNTPLYVARLNISGVVVGGYYNPLNGKAWAQYFETRGKTLF